MHDDEKCPDCDGKLEFLEKNTFTGRVWREYWCANCERTVSVEEGVALWQVLHDANETSPAPSQEPPAAERSAPKPWWKFWK